MGHGAMKDDIFEDSGERHDDPEERAASSSTVVKPTDEQRRDWAAIYAGLVELDAGGWTR